METRTFALVGAASARVQGAIKSRVCMTRKSVQRPHSQYQSGQQLRKRWPAASCAAAYRWQLAAGRAAASTSMLATSGLQIHEWGATAARNAPQQPAFRAPMSCAVYSRYTFSAWQFSLVWRHGRVETVGPRVRIIFSLCPEVETTLITFIHDH